MLVTLCFLSLSASCASSSRSLSLCTFLQVSSSSKLFDIATVPYLLLLVVVLISFLASLSTHPNCISSASQPCSGNNTRERNAYVLRQPGKQKQCPPYKEFEPCKLNSNCFHYSYNITGETHITLHLIMA